MPSKLEVKRTSAMERYRKRRSSKTVEQRDGRNKKRREKYMEQVVFIFSKFCAE